jgi:S1-C subfamily serine protease
MTGADMGLNWPELYGFYIYGNESTYVIHVEPNSLAESAGIRPGDKIIELDGDNVSEKPSNLLREIALKSKSCPPAISVQAASHKIEILPSKICKHNFFGFTVKGDLPILVDQICSNGPAYLAGLRSGDIIIGINDIQYKFSDFLKPIIHNNVYNLVIKFISLTKHSKIESVNNIESKREFINNDIFKKKLERAQIFYNTVSIS